MGRYGDDAATHREFKGLGVYSRVFDSNMLELTRKGYEVSYEIPLSPIIVKHHFKKGRRVFPHAICHMLRVKNVRKYFRSVSIENATMKCFAFSTFKGMKSIEGRLIPKPSYRGDFVIAEKSFFDERINVFYDRVKAGLNFVVERNKDYLNWRYLDPRWHRILVKQVTEGEEILGYCVLQVKGDGALSEGYIMDLLALPGRLDVASSLFVDACDYFDGLSVNAINYRVVAGHNYQKIASKLGFIDVRSNLPLMMYCHTDLAKKEFKLLENSQPSKIHFSYGDYY